jgi:hypothetical protein
VVNHGCKCNFESCQKMKKFSNFCYNYKKLLIELISFTSSKLTILLSVKNSKEFGSNRIYFKQKLMAYLQLIQKIHPG